MLFASSSVCWQVDRTFIIGWKFDGILGCPDRPSWSSHRNIFDKTFSNIGCYTVCIHLNFISPFANKVLSLFGVFQLFMTLCLGFRIIWRFNARRWLKFSQLYTQSSHSPGCWSKFCLSFLPHFIEFSLLFCCIAGYFCARAIFILLFSIWLSPPNSTLYSRSLDAYVTSISVWRKLDFLRGFLRNTRRVVPEDIRHPLPEHQLGSIHPVPSRRVNW